MILYAPIEWWAMTPKERGKRSNGCGSELDGSDKIVPDTMYGLCIKICCDIHDDMYICGETYGDKAHADAMFYHNLSEIIKNESSVFTKWLRMLRAGKYAAAVSLHGEKSFWLDKVKNNDAHVTIKGEYRHVSDYKSLVKGKK